MDLTLLTMSRRNGFYAEELNRMRGRFLSTLALSGTIATQAVHSLSSLVTSRRDFLPPQCVFLFNSLSPTPPTVLFLCKHVRSLTRYMLNCLVFSLWLWLIALTTTILYAGRLTNRANTYESRCVCDASIRLMIDTSVKEPHTRWVPMWHTHKRLQILRVGG